MMTLTTTTKMGAIMMVVIAAKICLTATNIVSSAIVIKTHAKIYGKRKNALKGRRRTNAIRRG